MSEINDYMLATDAVSKLAAVRSTVNRLHGGEVKLVDVVVSMGEYITGEDRIHQARVVGYLASVLEEVDFAFLSRHDVKLMVTYLSSRISTPHTSGIKEAAIGLRALAGMTGFVSNDARQLALDIFSIAPHFNESPALARLEVYKLLDFLMEKHRATPTHKVTLYIGGFLHLAEVEKDPRCLMIYYSMLTVVLIEWDIGNHIDKLWDSLARYYPITFTPRPNDPIGITADDLKLRLRACIAATSKFAPFSFPALIQKLDDQVKVSIKVDVMQTMSACIKSYSVQAVSSWSVQIWDALKYEVLNATDDILAMEALTTLRAIAARLSDDDLNLQTLESKPLLTYINNITKECVKYLHEPQQRYAKQSGQIIGRVATASPAAFYLVVRNVLPELLTISQDANAINKKKELLEVFIKLLDARFELIDTQETFEFSDSSTLDSTGESSSLGRVPYGGLTLFRDRLFELFALTLTTSSSQEPGIRVTSVQGLLRLAKLPRFLSLEEVGMIIQHLNKLVLDGEESGDSLRAEAILALQEVARLFPKQIEDITFPAFLGTLPDVTAQTLSPKLHIPILEALARIASDAPLFTHFVKHMMDIFDKVFLAGASQIYARIVLAAVLYAISEREVVPNRYKEPEELETYRFIVEYLYQYITVLTLDGDHKNPSKYYLSLKAFEFSENPMHVDDGTVELIGLIAMNAVRSMSVEDQQWAGEEVFTLFSEIPAESSKDAIRSMQIDSITGGPFQHQTLFLSMCLLAAIKREIPLNFDAQQVCCSVIRCFSGPGMNRGLSHEALLGIMALLHNKWGPIAPLPNSLRSRNPPDLIQDLITNLSSMEAGVVHQALDAALIFTHAANLKADRKTKDLLYLLIDELSNSDRGATLAINFKLVVAPNAILSRENSAVMKPLFTQRPFAICLSRILELFRTSNNSAIKSNYLVALSGILKYTPSEISLPEIERLLPLLLQSIDAIGPGVKEAAIDTLHMAIIQAPESVGEHISSIIKRLSDRIHNTTEKLSDSPSAVRVKALQCLGAIPHRLEDTILLPYKFKVLRELEYASSDVKRNVRDEAVRCRSSWFNLTEPAEEDD